MNFAQNNARIMIDDAWRYWAPGGQTTPGGPHRWHVGDWDQRRTISVVVDGEQGDEATAIGMFVACLLQ